MMDNEEFWKEEGLTSVVVKTVPYHKYAQLPETHDMAHRAMLKLRNKK